MVWAMVDADLLLKHSFFWLCAAADSGHVPFWAKTAAARDVTRRPIPNRARALNIQMDPNSWKQSKYRTLSWFEENSLIKWDDIAFIV